MIGRQLDERGMAELFRQDMVRDFPPEELKPLDVQMNMLRRGLCRALEYAEGGERIGYAVVCGLADRPACLLDYFAVSPRWRGQGCGGRILRALAQELAAEWSAILIETEKPELAEEEAARQERLRRDAFYCRQGVRRTQVSVRVFTVEYALWQLPLSGCLAEEALMQEYRTLYAQMLPNGGDGQVSAWRQADPEQENGAFTKLSQFL